MAKTLTALLAAVVLIGFVPVTGAQAYAADVPAAIRPVTDGAAPDIAGGQGGSSDGGVYFGNYPQSEASDVQGLKEGKDYIKNQDSNFFIEPVRWRVLKNADGKLFLLSDQNLDCVRYNEVFKSVTWESCTMRAWLNGGKTDGGTEDNTYDYTDDSFMKNAFSGGEKAAVAITKVTTDNGPNNTPGGNATNDQLFLLSTGEAMNTDYGFTDNTNETDTRYAKNTDYAKSRGAWTHLNQLYYGNGYWWLRSPGSDSYGAAGVGDSGDVYGFGSSVDYNGNGARPAFNLNLKSVLFTSAAAGGKSSGAAGANALKEVGGNTSGEWKFTLRDDGTLKNADGNVIKGLDGHKGFAVSSVATCDGNSLDIGYSGAATGGNEYISAIITDKPVTDASAKIRCYGRIRNCKAAKDASDTATVNIKDKLESGDTLYVFSEQFNGDKKTDFASSLIPVTVPQASGHKWKFEKFTWTGSKTKGYTKAAAKYTCKNNAKHTKTVNAALTSRVTKPNCTAGGKTTYTATVSKAESPDGKAHSESRTAKITKARGHRWGAWKVTKKPTAAKKGEKKRVCKNDASHVQKKSIPATGRKPEPKPVRKAGGPILAKMTAKGKRSLRITWTRAANADGYDVFLTRCNHGGKTIHLKKVKTVRGNKARSWTRTVLRTKKPYKACVKAWVMKNGKKKYVRTSPMIHAYTAGGSKKKYTNPKSVKVKKTKISLRAGKEYRIKAKVIKLKKGRRLMPKGHASKLRYLSSNKKIATVSSRGKIRARSKGRCKIFVYAANGASKAVQVTVN